MAWPKGRRAHNWKGGRVVDPRGYVLLYVGKDHPLADVRGYAYEHRIVAQQKIAKPLSSSDLIHHENEIKGDNSGDNLELTNRKDHLYEHRRPDSRLRKRGEENETVSCACGCGARFLKFDNADRPRAFVSGHNLAGENNGR